MQESALLLLTIHSPTKHALHASSQQERTPTGKDRAQFALHLTINLNKHFVLAHEVITKIAGAFQHRSCTHIHKPDTQGCIP